MSSGTKRPYDRDDKREDEKRSKPKDWRDAFLDEDEPRRHGSDRHSHSSRDSRDHRTGSSRDHRDRERDRRGSNERERETGREKERDHYREREKGDSTRRYGDTRDQRPNRDYTHDSHASSARRPSFDREEGEIESSPVKVDLPLPTASAGSDQPIHSDAAGLAPPRGFQAVSVPTGPKSRVPQTRPPPPQDEEVELEEKDPEVLLEERRRKRAEIMAKFQAQGRTEKPVDSAAASPAPDVGTGQDSYNSGGIRTGATSLLKQLGTRSTSKLPPASDTPTNLHEPSLASTPQGHDFDLTKSANSNNETVPPAAQQDQVGADAMISAADYDPTQDMKNDRNKRIKDSEAAQVADGVGEPIIDATKPEDEWEEVEIEVDDEDEEMDMFAAFDDDAPAKKKKKITVRRLKAGVDGDRKQEIVKKSNTAAALQVVDNVDDTDGYYRITPGEILDDGRYQVTITLGKGMFSAVVKAKILKAVDRERRQDVVGKEVAIKIIRSQESMYVAGRKEASILQKLNEADPEDKKHVVRMERTFEHRGHLCIVTESLSMNLRDVIKRFGKDVGLNMRAVRAYAHQMFLALSLLRKTNIVHADIKPDNILVTENKATLKLCDLGSASDVKDGEITPYLVSRFYRAPEIILGLPYDTAIDVWSIGCTLYELYTGKILFPGKSNNHMLLLMMEVKGKLNHRMIKKASLGEMHFDEQLNFISIEQDKITRQDVAKVMNISKATRDLRSRLLPPSSVQLKMKEDELKQLQHFVDLLDKCLQLDPARRITPRDALLHPFLVG